MVNVLNSFYGGISRDDTLFNQGEYVYSDGFDITRYPGELRPMPTPQLQGNIGAVSSVGIPTCILLDGDITIGMSNGMIRKPDGTLVYDTDYQQDIIYGTYFGTTSSNEYWLFLSNRVLKGTRSSAYSFSGFSTAFSGAFITKPVQGFGEIYFGAGRNVKRIDTFGNITNVYENDLPSNVSVSGLSINGGYLRVYISNHSSGSEGGNLDIIDVGSLTVSYTVKLPFNPSSLVSSNDFDFVLGGRDLYKCSGIQFASLCESFYSELTDKGAIGYIGNKFEFTSGWNTMDYTNERLTCVANTDQYIIYGSKHDGLPEVFCYGARDWLNLNHNQIYCIKVNKFTEDMWIAYNDGQGNAKVAVLPQSNYQPGQNTVTTATLITPYYNFGDYSTLKQLEEIRIGMTSLGDAEVYASIDGGNFELVDTINQPVRGEKIMYYKRDFHEISLKIVMTGIITGRKITNIDIRYTPYGL